MGIKKVSLLFAGILASTTSLANDPSPIVSDLNVKLGAFAVFESGFSSQNKLKGAEKNVSANKKGMAFFNNSAFVANISNTANDITYGAKIVLVPTTKKTCEPL